MLYIICGSAFSSYPGLLQLYLVVSCSWANVNPCARMVAMTGQLIKAHSQKMIFADECSQEDDDDEYRN